MADKKLVTLADVRDFLLDRGADDNDLLDDVQFDEPIVLSACQFAVDRYNSTPPFGLEQNYSVETFPHRALLIMGAAAYLLRATSLNMKRNQLDGTTAGGADVDDKRGKAEFYASLSSDIRRDFLSLMKEMKWTMNMERAYGSI